MKLRADRTRSPRRAGIVLILLSGLVVILLILAMLLLQVAKGWSRGADARREAAQSRLASASGMDYAAARLLQSSFPAAPVTGATRGDDWTERQGSGVSGQGSENPSYSHGEGWVDDGDGVFELGEPHRESDGDGRFSAWTGRLRGGAGPHALRFSLGIDALEGRIPLNAGRLPDGIDNDGNGLVDEPREIGFPGRDDNGNIVIDEPGEPDGLWGDVSAGHHRASLALVLDNLGSLLSDPATGEPLVLTRRWDIPAGADLDGDGKGDGEPLRASWLGEDLLAMRPRQGYRSWKEVEEALLNLDPAAFPGGPYQQAELDAIRPYLDLGPYGVPPNLHDIFPVNLHAAPREVLESLWRYMSAAPPVKLEYTSPPLQIRLLSGDFPGEEEALAKTCPHSRFSYAQFDTAAWRGFAVRPILFPSEAKRLADAAISFRKGGWGSERGWRAFRRCLADQAFSIFQEDAAALGTGNPTPVFQRSWVLAKANLAFLAVCEDPAASGIAQINLQGNIVNLPSFQPSSTRISWGVDRDADPANGIQPPPEIDLKALQSHYLPAFDPANPSPWGSTGMWSAGHYLSFFDSYGVPIQKPIRSMGLNLAPPLLFQIRSRMGETRLEGRFLVGERVLLSSVDELEDPAGARHLERSGIVPRDLPSLALRRDAPGGYAPRIVALGGANRNGAIGLGTNSDGPGGSQIYWPFTEGFDGPHTSPASIPPWREFWSDSPASFAPPTWCSLGYPPPYRPASALKMAPYGGECVGPLLNGAGTAFTGFSPPGIWTPSNLPQMIDQHSVEGRFSPGSLLRIGHPNPVDLYGYEISVRRSWRPPDILGNELAVRCRWTVIPGYLVDDRRTCFVPDSVANGAWSFPVLLTLRKVPGPAGGGWQTEFSLYVNGAQALAFRFPDPFPPSSVSSPPPLSWNRNLNRGAMQKFREPMQIWLAGVDEVRLSGGAVSPSSVGPRYVESGTFRSPLYSLDEPARLGSAQWTGASPEGGSIAVEAIGYRDTEGGDPLPSLPCGPDTAVADLKGALGEPVRSFRCAVQLTRPEGIDETPIFESIWITLQRRGTAPGWTTWESR